MARDANREANGLRAMNISSLSPESMEEEQLKRGIIKNMIRRKIHIASIQETHITKDRDYLMGNYRVITAAAAKKEKTGVVQVGNQL